MRAWDLNELRINNQAGLGATPNNQNVDYVGLRVLMKPLTFLKLALPIGRKTVDDRATIKYIGQHLDDPGIGAPFLDLRIPEAWFSGDFSEPASVIGHDGRHRMYAAAAAEGNNPIEVHLFPRGGLRNRDLTPEIIKHLQQGLNAQGTQGYVRGPLFDLATTVQEGRIIFGDEPVDVYVSGKNRQGDPIRRLIKSQVPANKVDLVIKQLAQNLNINPNSIVYGTSVPGTEVDEVAMNPTAFRQAVAQGQTEGVLVGYEFEVCIPEETIQNQPIANTPQPQPELTRARVIELIHDHDPNIDRFDIEDQEFGKFLDVFKFKNSNINWPNVKTMRQAMMEAQLTDLIAAFDAIPQRLRTQHVRTVKDELEQNASYRRMSRLGKQYKFAREFGQKVFYASRGYTANQGLYLRKLGQQPNRLVEVLAWALGVTSYDVENNFLDYFTFDNPQAAYDYLELDYYERGDDEDEDWDPEYRKAAKILKAQLEATYQKNVVVFDDYHQRVKNLTDWYVEPDGSLDASAPDDATAEIVSPPYPAAEAMTVLNKFFSIAENLKLYTNSSTGLHINVSIPKNIDVLKLAVLLGDQYVLKHYGRQQSGYARSVMRDIRTQGSGKVAAKPRDLAKLVDIAKNISGNHTASINYNGKYVSFRHAGGAYLKDPQGVTNTVGRFIQAMVIAADPTAYRNEYLTKLTKLFPEQPQLPGGSSLKADQRRLMAVINDIRMNGIPVIVQDTAGVGPIRPGKTREMQQVSVEANSEAARQTMLDRIRAPGNRERIQAWPLANFTRTTFIRPPEFLVPSTNDVGRTAQNSYKFYTFTDSRLPPGHPATINYIKAIAAPIMKRLRAQPKKRK
jgi:hypothetical protein